MRQSIAVIFSILWLLPMPLWAQVSAVAVHQPHVHDPCMIAADGFFYVYSTGRNVPFYRSSDLFNWSRCGTVFDSTPSWATTAVPGASAAWAPDISFFNGSYHLYYSISTFGRNRSCIGLTINKTLDPASTQYKWIDQGKVVESFQGGDFNAIDPCLIFDENHTPWLVLGSCWGGIRLRQLDAETGKPSMIDTTLYPLATRPGGKLIEGPFIVHHDDYFYLFVSFDACCRGVASTYNIRVGRSHDITGPYLDMDRIPMMRGGGTLVAAGQGDVHGPGGNSVLMNTMGHDWIVNHFYDATDRGRSRLQIREMVWDDNGWPMAGEPVQSPVTANAVAPKTDLTGNWKLSVDFGDEKTVRFNPDGSINPGGAWSATNGKLTLHVDGGFDASGCFIAENGKWFTGRDVSGRIVRGRRGQ